MPYHIDVLYGARLHTVFHLSLILFAFFLLTLFVCSYWRTNRFMRLVSSTTILFSFLLSFFPSLFLFHFDSTTKSNRINFVPELFVQLLTLKYGFIALVESLTCHLCSFYLTRNFVGALKMTGHFLVVFVDFCRFLRHSTAFGPYALLHDLFLSLFSISSHEHIRRMNVWIYVFI